MWSAILRALRAPCLAGKMQVLVALLKAIRENNPTDKASWQAAAALWLTSRRAGQLDACSQGSSQA